MAGVMNDQSRWWSQSWHERSQAVCAHFGVPFPPKELLALRQDEIETLVPGAYIVRRRWGDSGSLYFTVGLTQPIEDGATASAWELAVYTEQPGNWAAELLADLMSDCERIRRSADGPAGPGDTWPVTFYRAAEGDLHAGVLAPNEYIRPASGISRVYIWPDHHLARPVPCSTGSFFFMVLTGVTSAEASLSDETSPPHLLTALQLYGNGQRIEPARPDVTNDPKFIEIWNRVRRMNYDELMREMIRCREGHHRTLQ